MSAKTVMSSDWIEVHDHGSVYEVMVFLTDEDKAYMITRQENKKKFFKVDAKLLKIGELKFFERARKKAIELPIKKAIDIGLIGG